jgi:hypothetical protein
MSDFDPAEFSVNWADRSDSTFYAIDSGTYPARVTNVDWRKTRETQDPMAVVTFEFPEVRTSKPKKGRSPGSSEQETVTERNRQLRNYFTFQKDFAIENAWNYLIATEVTTKEELEALSEGPEVTKLFLSTEGAELAVRIQKYQPDKVKNPGALVDEQDNSNNIKNFYAKGTVQYERALAATGAGIDASQVTMAKSRKR